MVLTRKSAARGGCRGALLETPSEMCPVSPCSWFWVGNAGEMLLTPPWCPGPELQPSFLLPSRQPWCSQQRGGCWNGCEPPRGAKPGAGCRWERAWSVAVRCAELGLGSREAQGTQAWPTAPSPLTSRPPPKHAAEGLRGEQRGESRHPALHRGEQPPGRGQPAPGGAAGGLQRVRGPRPTLAPSQRAAPGAAGRRGAGRGRIRVPGTQPPRQHQHIPASPRAR